MEDELYREWTETIDGSSVSTAPDGSVYIAGFAEGDAFLSKYNSDGSRIEIKPLDTSEIYYAKSIGVTTEGSVYILGIKEREYGGYFLSKFNSDGTRAWRQNDLFGETWGGIAETAISISADGSIYIAGSAYGGLDGQSISGDMDAFLSKYNSDGSKAWIKLLGTPYEDGASSVSTAADGSVYIVGDTSGDLDGQINNGRKDTFLTKYKSDGSRKWTRLIGSSASDYGTSVSTAPDGSVYVTGSTFLNGGNTGNNYWDSFLSKYNSNGPKNGHDCLMNRLMKV